MKALLAAFEPFGGEAINASAEAVGRVRTGLGQLEVSTIILPTMFGRSTATLRAAIQDIAPDIVLAVGQASERAGLAVERLAVNLDDAAIADNAGVKPVECPVAADGPPAYFATLPVSRIAAALRRAGLPAYLSNSAGTFVCNHVFYGLMHDAAQRPKPIRAGFLHVPQLPQQAASRGGPSMALEHIVHAIEITLAVTAEGLADEPPTE